jgi:hypothetical protein
MIRGEYKMDVLLETVCGMAISMIVIVIFCGLVCLAGSIDRKQKSKKKEQEDYENSFRDSIWTDMNKR